MKAAGLLLFVMMRANLGIGGSCEGEKINKIVRFLFATVCLAGTAFADCGVTPLDASEVQLCTHPEHPGAAGKVIAENGGWRLCYDFSNGGHAMGMVAERLTAMP